jgi:hypothetical protein
MEAAQLTIADDVINGHFGARLIARPTSVVEFHAGILLLSHAVFVGSHPHKLS